MLRKLLPLILVLLGAGGGIGAGLALRPAPEAAPPVPAALPKGERSYVKLANQFVVPVMEGGRVGALVVLSLGLEVDPGRSESVFAQEPRLRDEFLRVLFDHANAGGFRGTFTDGARLDPLRRAMLEAAHKVLGPDTVSDVLITDIVRQD